MTQAAGFAGMQILPMRGWGFRQPPFPAEAVFSREDAWNAGSLTGAIKRHRQRAGEEEPLIKDWVLFGKRAPVMIRNVIFDCRFPNSIYVQHRAPKIDSSTFPGPLEVHPELQATLEWYLAYDHGLVLDFRHLRRLGRDGQLPSVCDQWGISLTEALRLLAPRAKLIHLQALESREWDELITYGGELGKLLVRCREAGTVVPVIIEYQPSVKELLQLPSQRIARLKAIREAVTRYL